MILNDNPDDRMLTNIEKLYMTAFPKSERQPFSHLMKIQSAHIFSLEEDNKFAGLCITIVHDDLCLLDYFAVSDEMRGQGIGTKALYAICDYYKDKRLFLEIESTKESFADNIDYRNKRKGFYMKAGFVPENYEVTQVGVRMEIMTYNCNVSFGEYIKLYENNIPKDYLPKKFI